MRTRRNLPEPDGFLLRPNASGRSGLVANKITVCV